VPGYLAFVTGGAEASRARRGALTVAFVAGFSLAFVAIGLAIGAAGASTAAGSLDLVPRLGGVLIIAFGLWMLGLLNLPFLNRDIRFHGKAPAWLGPAGGAAVLGAAFGVGWSPCVGPILGAILVLAGVGGGAGSGALLLGAYAGGLAVPFLVLGFAAQSGAGWVKRITKHGRVIERVGGVFLIALGIAVFTGATARLTSLLV